MRFALTAVDRARQVVGLDLDGPDETAVREAANARGYVVLTIRRKAFSGLPAREQRFATTLFSIELLALLDAGLNIVEALQTLEQKETKVTQRAVLTGLRESLFRGRSFSQSLEDFPQIFSPLYVATVRSSERTGDIKQALSRYIAYQDEFDRVRKKLVAALIYPAILVTVGTLVLGFLLFYVVPRFAGIYEESGADLPFFSGLLVGVGRWIEHNGLLSLAALAATALFGAYIISRKDVQAGLLAALYRNASIGERLRVYQLGRFYRTVAMLLKAGVPALRALEMVMDLLPPNMRRQLADAIASLNAGKAMSASLTAAGLATAVATRMLAVGERGGQMGEMMDRIARFCDDETARFVDAFTRVFEPLLMALLGLAVGTVVVLMYMPVFELAGSVR